MKRLGAWIGAGLCLAASSSLAADKVMFGTNWLAEAELGGYYQALADGTYAQYGLDVTIKQGGPQSHNGLMLAAGKLDFYIGSNLLLAFYAVEEDAGIIVVAAHFQKDPIMVMSHPGVGLDHWQDLPKATAYIAKEGVVSFYQWMTTAYGFKLGEREAVYVQCRSVHRRQELDRGRLCHLGTVRGRARRPLQAQRFSARRPRLFFLLDNHRNAQRYGGETS